MFEFVSLATRLFGLMNSSEITTFAARPLVSFVSLYSRLSTVADQEEKISSSNTLEATSTRRMCQPSLTRTLTRRYRFLYD